MTFHELMTKHPNISYFALLLTDSNNCIADSSKLEVECRQVSAYNIIRTKKLT